MYISILLQMCFKNLKCLAVNVTLKLTSYTFRPTVQIVSEMTYVLCVEWDVKLY